MRGVRGRDVQGGDGVVGVCCLRCGEVFGGEGSGGGIYVSGMPFVVELGARERRENGLYVQCWLHWEERDDMCGVRHGDVQGRERASRV